MASLSTKLEHEMLNYFRKGMNYKQLGKWKEAAGCDKMCGKLLKQLKRPLESATLMTEAGFGFLKVDKTEALVCLNTAIVLYCDHGKFNVAARLERRVADIHFINRHWEEAALHFRKAANFLSGEQLFDQCDSCLELAAYCFVEMKEYRKAFNTYVTIANGSVQSNLRSFNARGFLMSALLCLLAAPIVIDEFVPPLEPTPVAATNKKGKVAASSAAADAGGDDSSTLPDDGSMVMNADGEMVESATAKQRKRQEKERIAEVLNTRRLAGAQVKYDEVMAKHAEFDRIDVMWRCSKEAKFISNIVRCRVMWDQENFARHLYYWNNVRPLDRQSVVCLHTMHAELEAEMKRLEDIKTREKRDKERARIKKEKLEKQKKVLKELGVAGEAMVDDDDVEKELIAQEEALAKRIADKRALVGGAGKEGEGEGGGDEEVDVAAVERGANAENDYDDDDDDEGGGEEEKKPARRRRQKGRRKKG